MPESGQTLKRKRAALQRGAWAEGHVARWLQTQGWTVLFRNWRGGGGELDLVVGVGGKLRIVEVKARASGDPLGLESVTPSKQKKLRRAALAFLDQYGPRVEEVCFSVALVELVEGAEPHIEFIEDAFDG